MNKILNSKKKVFIAAIAVLLIAGGGYWYWHAHQKPKTIGIGGVNYGPPTKAEKKETEAHKKALENNQNNPGSSDKSSKTVTITYLSTTEARGFVSNVIEDGGTCTITLTMGGSKVTATSQGVSDVNKTTCAPISIPQGQLTSGSWTAVLSYASSKATGSSPPQKLSVP